MDVQVSTADTTSLDLASRFVRFCAVYTVSRIECPHQDVVVTDGRKVDLLDRELAGL